MPGKRSTIWDHFKKASKKRAVCKHCHTPISFNGGSIGNLSRHMKLRHPFVRLNSTVERADVDDLNISVEEVDEVNKTTQEQQQVAVQQEITTFLPKPPTKKKVESVNIQLVKMIAKGHHALRLVEEPEMIKFVDMTTKCPGYSLPSRKTLSEGLIPKVFNELEANIRTELQEAFAICLTTDCWTSSTNASYIGVTAHYIGKNTTICSYLLCCKEFDANHSSENLCYALKNVVEDWNISSKIAAIVSDNAPNIKSAVRLGGWRSIGCFAHSLNLVVQKAISEIEGEVDKVKRVVEYFNRSSQGGKKLKEFQIQMQIPTLKVKQDVPTRWNSTYDMLSRIVKIKDAVMSTLAILRSDLIIDVDVWEVIKGALPLLKPFYDVTEEISSEKNVTLSKIIVLSNLIQSYLAKMSPTNEKILLLHKSLMQGIQTRFQNLETNMLYAECTFLDPRFKKKGFRDQNACDATIKLLKNKISHIDIPQHQSEGDTESEAPETHGKVSDSIWDDYDMQVKNIVRPQNKTVAAIVEIDKYINEPYLGRQLDPLEWWNCRKDTYPYLYHYILKRFCIVATSVPCERVFSSAGQVVRDRRTLLTPSKVEKLVFLHSNM